MVRRVRFQVGLQRREEVQREFDDDPRTVLKAFEDRKAEGILFYKQEDFLNAKNTWRDLMRDTNHYIRSGVRSENARAHPNGGEPFTNGLAALRYTIMCNMTQLFLTLM